MESTFPPDVGGQATYMRTNPKTISKHLKGILIPMDERCKIISTTYIFRA
jgi:hypothetical protein